MESIDIELARYRALHAIAIGLTRLKWLRDAERLTLAMLRHDRALKAGFNPEQPRDELGRWTDANGSVATSRQTPVASQGPTSGVPAIPKEKPATSRERVAAYKLAARVLARLAGPVGLAFEGASSLYNHRPIIETYNDPPKSFEKLKQNVSLRRLGYDTHHIVEKSQAEADGYSKERINGADNLVRISRMKHWEINAWYQTNNPDYGGMSPRDYLKDKDWQTRRAVGLDALKKFGVLKP